MNPIITGMVITVYESYGFISVDNACKSEANGDVMFAVSSVNDGRKLQYRDRVELEVERTDKGWRALWVKYTGHETEEVIGTGHILRVFGDGTGRIRPDVEGADPIKFWLTGAYKSCVAGDRVEFIARQDRNGRWQAKSVRKTDSPVPPARDWRDSWKEDAC
jgi:cold shock CspA family protein